VHTRVCVHPCMHANMQACRARITCKHACLRLRSCERGLSLMQCMHAWVHMCRALHWQVVQARNEYSCCAHLDRRRRVALPHQRGCLRRAIACGHCLSMHPAHVEALRFRQACQCARPPHHFDPLLVPARQLPPLLRWLPWPPFHCLCSISHSAVDRQLFCQSPPCVGH